MTKLETKQLSHERRIQVLTAAAQVIQERGLNGTRLADIGEVVGMSASNLVYYFDSKEELLSQTIIWAEDYFYTQLYSQLAKLPGPKERLVRLIEFSFPPDKVALSEWGLWLELLVRAVRDPAMSKLGAELEKQWANSILACLQEGINDGAWELEHPKEFALTLAALIDGLAIRVLSGGGVTSRQAVNMCLRLTAEHLGFDPPARARRRSHS